MRARTQKSRHGSTRTVLVVMAVVAIWGAISIAPRPIGTEAGAQEPSYAVEVTPSTNLVDGQAMQVVVRAAPGHRLGDSGIVRLCRDGATYATPDDVNPMVAGNCPDRPISSSASDPWPIRSYPDGSTAVTTFRAGTGTVEWGPTGDTKKFSLTCDPTTPCRLVVSIVVDGREVIDSQTLLTYTTSNPVGACGGTAADAVDTTGPDRLSPAWVSLTRQKCIAEGSAATSTAVLAGEGEGQLAFQQGLSDLTYSAVGPRFPTTTTPIDRPSVSVPFALNATVIGVLGGYPTAAADWPRNVPRPYADLKVTMVEMATLFGQGRYLFDAFHFDALQQRNPELLTALSLTNNDRGNPLAPAGSEAVTWTATSAFDAIAPDQWKSPPQDIAGNVPDAPRGVHDSLAKADPPFTFSLFELYSSQGLLKRLVADFAFRPFSYGPVWVLTDLATARDLGIPTVALQNRSGEFVQPSDASLRAAAPSLQRQADGTYLPVVGAEGPGAYPLTFVEHAVAPTDVLVDETCAPRTGTQAQLSGWLRHLTGPGQPLLPDGLVPLDQAMLQDAATTIELVGTTQPEACAPAPPPPTPTPETSAVAVPPVGGGDPSFGDFPVGSPSTSGPGAGPVRTSSAPTGSGLLAEAISTDESGAALDGDGEDEVALAEIAYPDPAAAGSGSPFATALALVVLAILVAVGGALSAGRRPALPGRSRR